MDDMVIQYSTCTLKTNFNGAWREGDKIPFIIVDYNTGKCQFLDNDCNISRTFDLELSVR